MSSTSNEQFSMDLFSRCKFDQMYFFAAKVSVKSIFRSRQVLYKTGSVWVVISGYVFYFTSGERPSTVIFIKKLNCFDLSLIRNDSVGVSFVMILTHGRFASRLKLAAAISCYCFKCLQMTTKGILFYIVG